MLQNRLHCSAVGTKLPRRGLYSYCPRTLVRRRRDLAAAVIVVVVVVGGNSRSLRGLVEERVDRPNLGLRIDFVVDWGTAALVD